MEDSLIPQARVCVGVENDRNLMSGETLRRSLTDDLGEAPEKSEILRGVVSKRGNMVRPAANTHHLHSQPRHPVADHRDRLLVKRPRLSCCDRLPCSSARSPRHLHRSPKRERGGGAEALRPSFPADQGH
eukprot:107039-Hanusia_phi.AAC.2